MKILVFFISAMQIYLISCKYLKKPNYHAIQKRIIISCPCGNSGKTVKIPIQRCLVINRTTGKRTFETCNKKILPSEDPCNRFKYCAKCRDHVSRCVSCPAGRVGKLCSKAHFIDFLHEDDKRRRRRGDQNLINDDDDGSGKPLDPALKYQTHGSLDGGPPKGGGDKKEDNQSLIEPARGSLDGGRPKSGGKSSDNEDDPSHWSVDGGPSKSGGGKRDEEEDSADSKDDPSTPLPPGEAKVEGGDMQNMDSGFTKYTPKPPPPGEAKAERDEMPNQGMDKEQKISGKAYDPHFDGDQDQQGKNRGLPSGAMFEPQWDGSRQGGGIGAADKEEKGSPPPDKPSPATLGEAEAEGEDMSSKGMDNEQDMNGPKTHVFYVSKRPPGYTGGPMPVRGYSRIVHLRPDGRPEGMHKGDSGDSASSDKPSPATPGEAEAEGEDMSSKGMDNEQDMNGPKTHVLFVSKRPPGYTGDPMPVHGGYSKIVHLGPDGRPKGMHKDDSSDPTSTEPPAPAEAKEEKGDEQNKGPHTHILYFSRAPPGGQKGSAQPPEGEEEKGDAQNKGDHTHILYFSRAPPGSNKPMEAAQPAEGKEEKVDQQKKGAPTHITSVTRLPPAGPELMNFPLRVEAKAEKKGDKPKKNDRKSSKDMLAQGAKNAMWNTPGMYSDPAYDRRHTIIGGFNTATLWPITTHTAPPPTTTETTEPTTWHTTKFLCRSDACDNPIQSR